MKNKIITHYHLKRSNSGTTNEALIYLDLQSTVNVLKYLQTRRLTLPHGIKLMNVLRVGVKVPRFTSALTTQEPLKRTVLFHPSEVNSGWMDFYLTSALAFRNFIKVNSI
jgi:hypothetical protein